ncbi:gliding motility-associated C-terminal domain-containing protein [Emticicia sp.]|uniref:T9SS type B sorting domain-containing protein n=1 Tax=Emticicia sp. TaxID=1930953 RepID=UPI003751B54C
MRNLSRIFFLLLFSTSVYAQGLCDKTGVEKGGFTFETPSTICIGQEVRIKDNSGGTEVKYIFGYQGEDASKLAGLNPTTNTKWSFLAAGQYVILQYGKKNGKEMYFCNLVTVRENNKPDISYEACNNSLIILTIRNSPANNFDSYRIKWSDGSIDNIPIGTVLPYSVKKTFPVSAIQNLLVEGLYTIPNNCPAAQPITINMDRGEMFPRIEKIELSEDGKEATITLKGNPDADYYISSRSIDQAGAIPNSSMPKVKAGIFKMTILNPAKSQCFAVGRVGQGGCYEYSNEVCSIPFTLKPIDDDYQITWQPSSIGKIQNTGVFTYVNQVVTQIIREEGTNKLTFNGVTSPYLDITADCSKKYCYTLSSKIISAYAGYTGSTYNETATVSQKQCVDRKSVHPPAITDGFVSVNPTDAISLNFNDNSTWSLIRKKYRLYRVEDNGLKQIDSSLTVKTLTDASINASEKSYCYKVSFVDKCDSESDISPAFCSILLNENAIGNLLWTNQSPFGNTIISKFEVQSYDERTNIASTEVTKNATEITYIPLLDKFDEEAKYQIKIISNDGKESLSNIYIIPISVKLFLPDAFSPNDDNINDNLEIKGSTKRIIDFEMQVYNRWGNPVFTSNDVTTIWDGKFQNASAPTDIYTYKIYAKLKNGQEFNKSGKFLLLR